MMWLRCEVDVLLRPVEGVNIRKTSRPSRAFIAIGKEGRQSKEITMLICTGSKGKISKKYPLSENIVRIYRRFVNEGKATISQRNPAQDICINKANPDQLRTMMSLLSLMIHGADISRLVTLRSDLPQSPYKLKMLQRTMVVTTRLQYPLTSSFPRFLQNLTVTGCAMKRLDPRIVELNYLDYVNLSNNMLSKLPEDLSRWESLSVLNLSSNRLTELPPALYRSCVKDTLAELRLNSNSLTYLPPQVCRMKALVQLHIDDNELTALPPTIGSMSRLANISAQRNQITQLPSGIIKLKLDYLDLFGNPIRQLEDSVLLSSNLGVPTLKEVTSRFIRRQEVAYTQEDLLPHLIFYLENARQCWCGRYCFESCARYLRKCNLSDFSSTVLSWNGLGSSTVPVEAFLCSTACLQKFQSNPFAYWK